MEGLAMLRGILCAVAFGLLTASVAHATTWYVPDDFSTIQAAISSSSVVEGDTVIVRPGTYVENIDFLGKAITLVSDQGADVTTIDGNQTGSVVTFVSGETETSVLKGFTITNGKSNRGGGIFASFSSPKILANIVTANTAEDVPGVEIDAIGGGVYCENSSVRIEGNRIDGNSTVAVDWYRNAWGGGIYCKNCDARIRRNRIRSNSVISNGTYDAGGGGIAVAGGSVEISGNEITENLALSAVSLGDNTWGGGIFCLDSHPAILNNVILGNRVENHCMRYGVGGGISIRGGTGGTIANNVIADNYAYAEAALGGGVALHWVPEMVFTGNTIAYNNAYSFLGYGGGGIYLYGAATFPITDTVFWGNHVDGEIWQIDSDDTVLEVSYCDIQPGSGWTGPGAGILNVNPGFVNAPNGDYHLRIGSPCVDAGSPVAARFPSRDYEGDDRIVDGDLDGVAVADMGADELLPEVAARFGTVNAGGDGLANVLLVNEGAGSRKRIRSVSVGEAIHIRMKAPPAGPDPAPFALYAWVGENETSNLAPQPFGLGTMCYPTIVSGGDPQPYRIWNNIGKNPWLGTPHFSSVAAPSIVVSVPGGWPNPITVTLQGFILDNGSAADKPASITNAVILKVVE